MDTKQQNRGGKREKAGNKKKYGEKTITIAFRVPISIVNDIKKTVKNILKSLENGI